VGAHFGGLGGAVFAAVLFTGWGCGGSPGPSQSSGLLTGAITVSVNDNYACAVMMGGTVMCWGSNGFGQLGNGTNTSTGKPVVVTGLSSATAVSAGLSHVCAVLADHTAVCWGNGGQGELGASANVTASNTPVAVPGLTNVAAIAAGALHTCAVLTDGTAQCWGDNTDGALGNGTTSTIPSGNPTAVTGLSGATAIAAGSGFSCAVLAGGAVSCWGRNTSGQLGTHVLTSTVAVPTATTLEGLSGVTSLSAGTVAACVVLSDGSVRCWGANPHGGIGIAGATALSNTPVVVAGLSGASAVSAGSTSCAVTGGGAVECWGDNSRGQLGNGPASPNTATPTPVTGLVDAISVSADPSHVCSVLADHTIRCWGETALGNGTLDQSTIERPVGVVAP
jgi:alpha-tubulin suppressor-like RCC1 family protein